jgi:hypothetical protein
MFISESQITAMDDAMFAEYQRQLIAFYRDRAPHFMRRFSDDYLKGRLSHVIPQARVFGLNSAEGIMLYAALALVAGPGFDDDLEVRRFMTLRGSKPEVKVKRLFELVVRNLGSLGRTRG